MKLKKKPTFFNQYLAQCEGFSHGKVLKFLNIFLVLAQCVSQKSHIQPQSKENKATKIYRPEGNKTKKLERGFLFDRSNIKKKTGTHKDSYRIA